MAGKNRLLLVVVLLVVICLSACRTAVPPFRGSTAESYRDGETDLNLLALRFAPRLYLQQDEPYDIMAIIPVHHPARPVIAYHIFFEEEVINAGRGKDLDPEIMWVEYDPVTLKVADVATLWHRTVLRRSTCTVNAKASQQRPSVYVQWGQHGIMPLGWETPKSARPYGELLFWYNWIRTGNRIPGVQKGEVKETFSGEWKDYITFAKEVDAVFFVQRQEIIEDERPYKELESRINRSFDRKKEWPWWSPR